METRDVLIGLIIGVFVCGGAWYLLSGDSDHSDYVVLESQLNDITQQLDTMEDMIIDLQSEIESLEPTQEEEGEEELNPAPTHYNELGRWESIEGQMMDPAVLTENITITKNPVTIRWLLRPGDTTTIMIIIADAESNDQVYEIFRENVGSGITRKALDPGKYYLYAVSEEQFILTVDEPA